MNPQTNENKKNNLTRTYQLEKPRYVLQMYRIHRGTKPKRCRQVRLFSELLPHTLPKLMIQRGGASLLFSFTYENGVSCERWREPPFIVFKVGSRQKHIWKVIRRSRGHATSKCTWTGGRPGVADPRGRPAPHVSHSSLSSSETLTCGP